MAAKDYFANGQWNFFCDLCGAKNKSSDAARTWNNLMVCKHHKEVRNPQDFLRGVKDDQSVPWSRPEPADTFVATDYTRFFDEETVSSETVSKSINKLVNSSSLLMDSSRTVNGSALNVLGLNAGAPIATVDLEQIVLTEAVKFSIATGTKAESLPVTETFAKHLQRQITEALPLGESVRLAENEVIAMSVPLAEVTSLRTGKALSDSLAITEALTFRFTSGSTINGGAINKSALNS